MDAAPSWGPLLDGLEERTRRLEDLASGRDVDASTVRLPLPTVPVARPSADELVRLQALQARTDAALTAAERRRDGGLKAALAYSVT